jgi:hypothetical protein
MYFYSFIALLFLIAILLSSFVEGGKLKIMYWLVVILLFISVFNIYLTTKYYIKLRNNPGIRGERGDPGTNGDNGSRGVCVIDTKCMGTEDCRDLIDRKILEMSEKYISPEYPEIIKKRDDGIKLNSREQDIYNKVTSLASIIETKCEKFTPEEIVAKLEKALKDF